MSYQESCDIREALMSLYTLRDLLNTIEQQSSLREMDKIQAEGIMSSAIASATYDKDTKTLIVHFVQGGSHTYEDVPEELGEAFAKSPSGSVFNAQIRNQY